MYKKRFQHALERHLKLSRDVSKHFMKQGKRETSTVISHKVTIEDEGEAHLKTTIELLPIRRMYNYGVEVIDDEYLMYEMEEDVEV